MKFSVKERLMLLSVMPSQGNLVTLRLVRQAREELGFNEEEHESLSLGLEENSYHWDDKAEAEAGPKEIELGPVVRDIILKAFDALDFAESLELIHLALYERFIEDAQENHEGDEPTPIR